MSETTPGETPVERRLREMGVARRTARLLRRARWHVGCDEVRDGAELPCWKFAGADRCMSCHTTLVLSQALDEVLAVQRRALRSVNVFAERLARCEGDR